jgi:hypothetical protein
MGGRDTTIGEWNALTRKRVDIASWGFDPDAWARRRRSEADPWPTTDASDNERRDAACRAERIQAKRIALETGDAPRPGTP